MSVGYLSLEKKTRMICYIFIAFLLSTTINSCSTYIRDNNITANPIPIYVVEQMLGGLIPSIDSNGIKMQNASVLLEIKYIESEKRLNISFSGNYSFYNDNNTVDLLVGAPFELQRSQDMHSFVVKANGELIPSFLESYIDIADLFKEFFVDFSYSWSEGFFIFSNITFAAFSYTNISYSFCYSLDCQTGTYFFNYIVGTARYWEGKITEKVEIRFLGLESRYYEYAYNFGENAQTNFTRLEKGISFIWEWNDVIIEDNEVEFLLVIQRLPTYTSSTSQISTETISTSTAKITIGFENIGIPIGILSLFVYCLRKKKKNLIT